MLMPSTQNRKRDMEMEVVDLLTKAKKQNRLKLSYWEGSKTPCFIEQQQALARVRGNSTFGINRQLLPLKRSGLSAFQRSEEP